MIAKLFVHYLSLTSDDRQYRWAYLNFVSALLIAVNGLFFLTYNLFIDYYPALIWAMALTLILDITSVYWLLIKRNVSVSSYILVSIVFAMTHFYMFDVQSSEYALIYGVLNPVIAITLLPRSYLKCILLMQFMVFNYLLLVHIGVKEQQPLGWASYTNLLSVWLTVTVLFWYIDTSRLQANRKVYEAKDQLERLATTDSLTGVHNRRFIEKRLIEPPFIHSIALIDVDNFKQVNDHHGHSAGDGVLQSIAHILEHIFQRVGVVGRWGGEEFIILITEQDPKKAAEYLEHARLAICHYPMAISQSVSISVGWGRFHQENIEQSIRSVDKALYRAKANGKNQIQTASLLSEYR